MLDYYLRMAGVNFSNFVYDTNNLSTIRGGSLLLLNAVAEVEKKFEELKAISTGASVGLFEFKAEGDNAATTLRDDVKKYLATDANFKFATIMVDVIKADSDFKKDREKLVALNRWSQMQMPRFVLPVVEEDAVKECAIDRVRPAKEVDYKGENKIMVSDSVFARRSYGKGQKQKFYEAVLKKHLERSEESNIAKKMKFVNDLDKLTNDGADGKIKGNLHHKMAIIHIDGNGFRKIQNDQCKNPSDLKKFDQLIKTYRTEFLEKLLEIQKDEEDWKFKGGHRLEILLWGGDEFILAVPAWQGWKTLSVFYDMAKDWKLKLAEKSEDLTHSAGVVFCHHNAPIHRIKKLAEDLTNKAAKARKDDKGVVDKGNWVAYQVLESYDYVAGDLLEFRRSYLPEKVHLDNILIDGTKMSEIDPKSIAKLKENISRKKLFKLVQSAISQDEEKTIKAIKEFEDSLGEQDHNILNEFGNSGGIVKWIHLLQLWDYIC